LDALHLAIAASNEILLVTADDGLAESARMFGVDVQLLNPLDEG
jgi:predicted nucleic acid-binding protein